MGRIQQIAWSAAKKFISLFAKPHLFGGTTQTLHIAKISSAKRPRKRYVVWIISPACINNALTTLVL
jgi:hypothetical protein